MKKVIIFLVAFLLIVPHLAVAKDVHVKGYYRKDGTYVRPHIRSSPDSSRSNNYGPSRSSDQLMNPRQRDWDRDGAPNYLDKDDDNDGIRDNYDKQQYSPFNTRSKNPFDE
jgi:hypothetical protein